MQTINTPQVDLSQLLMVGDDDPAFVNEMIEMYKSVLCSDLEIIYKASENKDYSTLKKYIHKVKSNLKIFGAYKMLDILLPIEKAAENSHLPEDITVKMQEVKNINEQILEELNEFQERTK